MRLVLWGRILVKLFYIEHIRLGYMHIILSGLSLVTLRMYNIFAKSILYKNIFTKIILIPFL